jgi:hypothetical protein
MTTIDKYFDMFKRRVGIIGNDSDLLLHDYLDTAVQSVLNYTNRTLLPKEMRRLIISMAADAWRTADVLDASADDDDVSSVTMPGSMVISYGRSSKTKEIALSTVLNDRISKSAELQRFRSIQRVQYDLQYDEFEDGGFWKAHFTWGDEENTNL